MLFWIVPSYLPVKIFFVYVIVVDCGMLLLLTVVEKKNNVESFYSPYLWEEEFKSICVINHERQAKCVIQYIIVL